MGVARGRTPGVTLVLRTRELAAMARAEERITKRVLYSMRECITFYDYAVYLVVISTQCMNEIASTYHFSAQFAD